MADPELSARLLQESDAGVMTFHFGIAKKAKK